MIVNSITNFNIIGIHKHLYNILINHNNNTNLLAIIKILSNIHGLNYDPTETHLRPIPNWCGISLLGLKMLVVLLGSLQDLSKIFETEQFSRRGVKNDKLVIA